MKTKKPEIFTEQQPTSTEKPVWDFSSLYKKRQPLYSIITTIIFFAISLFGMLHHEMWRDEHQAWLIARESHSIPQLFYNMRFEGHPAIWHLLLYLITCFTHNPAYMQALHLLIACTFIFVFNRYAALEIPYRFLFSFGYFAIFEYTIISRCYGLATLLVFIVCALYKHRVKYYLFIGIALALLANISIYGVLISLGITGILFLDYFIYQRKNKISINKLMTAISVVIFGVVISLYMIIPNKENSFVLPYPDSLFQFERWTHDFSLLFTSYFYIPNMDGIHFWNSTIFYPIDYNPESPLWNWFLNNPIYLWTWIVLPAITFLLSLLIFMRKPLILILYFGITLGILSMFYYTDLLYVRYTGYLFITLILCYWLSEYYSEISFKNQLIAALSNFGKTIQKPFLILVLCSSIVGAAVAYVKDFKYEFSRTKEAAQYIHENKLDSLTIAGCLDYSTCAFATYLDKKLFYPQMNAYGTFALWSKNRKNKILVEDTYASIVNLMTQENKSRLLFVSSFLTHDNFGKPLEHGMIAKEIKVDLLKFFEGGIVADEKSYIYLVQKVDPKQEDLSQYQVSWDDPNDFRTILNKGEVYGKSRNYSAAIKAFKRAITINTNAAIAYKNLGASYGSIMKYQEAIENLKMAFALDSMDSQVSHLLGITYNKVGDNANGNYFLEREKRMNSSVQK